MEKTNGTGTVTDKPKAKRSRKPITVQQFAAKHNVSEFRVRRTLRKINGGTLPKGTSRYALTAKTQTALVKAIKG